MEWKPIDTVPFDETIYVYLPGWNGRGNLVRTLWRGYWMNEFLNGSMPGNFKPEWWAYPPTPPEQGETI